MREMDPPGAFDTAEIPIDDEVSETGSRVVRLAATRAALDPQRRAWRNDILVSAIVEVLSLYGARPLDQLLSAVRRVWGTDTVTQTAAEEALAVAREAGLVVTQTRLDGRENWLLSEGAKREAEEDVEWVRRCFDGFATNLLTRLDEVCDHPVRSDRGDRLADQMFAALVHAAAGALSLGRTAHAVTHLRPAEFDLDALRTYLAREVEPKTVASAMQEVALAIVDPADEFGERVLHLLVAGNVLQGLLSGRDLRGTVELAGTRIALDTSALVPLAQKGTPEGRLLIDLLQRTPDAGVEVVVAEHTLEEWERLWEAADGELRGHTEEQLQRAASYPFLRNPFVSGYLQAKKSDPHLSWPKFQIGRRDIGPTLEGFGVNIRPHGNHEDGDRAVQDAVERRLLELSESSARGRRPAAAEADAKTCAMVHRWRAEAEAGLPGGWFIARDKLTELAYRDTVGEGDPYPLVLSPSAWMVFVASVLADDPDEVNKLAVTLSSAVTRDAFLSAAAAHSLDEVLELTEIFGEDASGLSDRDVHLALQLELQGVIEESEKEPDDRAREVGIQAARTRSMRRDGRAAREYELAQQRMQDVDARVEAARVEALRSADAASDERMEEVQLRHKRQMRTLAVVVVATVLLVLLVVGQVAGMLSLTALLAGGAGWVVLLRHLHAYATSPDMSFVALLLSLGDVVGATALGALAGVIVARLGG